MFACFPWLLLAWFRAFIRESLCCGIYMVAKQPKDMDQALVLGALVKTYAVWAVSYGSFTQRN